MPSNSMTTESGALRAEEGQNYSRLWFTIWSHKWRIVTGVALGFLAAIFYHVSTGPWYESTARLLVIKKQLETAPISVPVNSSRVQEEYLPTHLMVIASPQVVKQAVLKNDLRSLGSFQRKDNSAQEFFDSIIRSLFGEKPKGSPEDGLTKSIIGSLVCEIPKPGITPSHEILDVSFRAKEPEDCQRVLNAVISSYQDFLKDTYHDINAETLEMIARAREVLQKDLETKETAYLEFRQKTPLLWKGKDGNTVDQERIFNIDSRRAVLRIRQMEIKSSLAAVEEGMKKGSAPAELLAMLPGLPSNREILSPSLLTPDLDTWGTGRTARVSLEEQLILLQLQESKQLEEYGPRHPEIQKTRQRLETVRGMLTPSSQTPMRGDKAVKDGDLVQTKIQLLKLELAENQRAEKALSDLFEHEQQSAKTATINQLTDDSQRQGIERSKILYESIVNRLKETASVQDYGGYKTQIIAPPPVGKLFLKKYALVLGLCLFVGLFGSAGWSYLVHISDKRFRTPQEIQQRLGLPVLGHIPRFATSSNGFHNGATNGTVRKAISSAHLSSESARAEAFRTVRTTALFGSQAGQRKIIQITSPNLGDGKTTLVANLAFSLAQLGKKILLIDADLRQPRLHTYYGLPNTLGLSSLLAGEAELASVIRSTQTPGLSVLTAGPLGSNPGELLASPRLKEVFEAARGQFDFVVVDTPALVSVIDPCVVAPQVDGVLLTLRIAKNGRPYAQQACEKLKGMGANVLGVVVNEASYDPGAGAYR